MKIHSEGSLSCFEIWVDTETGVNYLFRQSGYSGGMTVLLDRNGNPVVSPLPIKEED